MIRVKGEIFQVRTAALRYIRSLQTQVPGDTEHPGTAFANDVRICFAV